MQSTQPLNSAQPPKEADPHDVFAIESILAARADHRAPPLAHDPASQPAAPQVHVAPEISVAAAAPQVEPVFHATDVRNIGGESIRSDEIRIDDLKPLGEKRAPKWAKRIVMASLGLCAAIAAAGWQHYGDQAKAMAVSWAPQSVLAVLSPSETPPAAEPAGAAAIQAAAPDQAATTEQPAAQPAAPAKTEQAAAPAATVPSAESAPSAELAQLQAMAQDLAAMTRQVEELKANIAQLRTSHAQMAREVAKATDARASEARPPEQAPRPRVAAVPPPRAAAPPARKPPAQAAYIPPVQPLPPAPAPVQAQPAPPQMADDGQPVVRPPMPLR